MRRRPDVGVDVLAVRRHHHGGRHFFALAPGQLAVGHRGQPDIGIEADLMARMAGEHRAAARLRHVADEEPGPADLGAFLGEPLEELHQARMSPIAVAREPHHLPGLSVDRQRGGAGKAALGVEADDARFERRRLSACGRTIPWPGSGIVGLVERRQRLRIERALVLRDRGVRREKPERERDRKGVPPERRNGVFALIVMLLAPQSRRTRRSLRRADPYRTPNSAPHPVDREVRPVERNPLEKSGTSPRASAATSPSGAAAA